jgi:Dyp-type peroxidase family
VQGPLQTILQNVQGNILHSHGRDFATHTFLQFQVGKEADVKDWLRTQIVGEVVSAQDQLTERQVNNREALFVSCLLSASGYSFLRGPASTLKFSTEFKDGMKQAAGRLQDPPYTSWEKNYREAEEIHAMILLAHCDEKSLLAAQKTLVDAYIGPLTKRQWVECGNVLRQGGGSNGRRVEHFNYVDGGSQPLFFQQDLDKEKRERGIQRWDPSAGPSLVLTRDPLGRETDYGSYFVFRKLQQYVERFEQQIDTLASQLGVSRDEAKALVVGRFPDGKPLASHNTSFVYPNPHNAVPNDFLYDQDVDGQLCPYHAHIRRMNPRWEIGGLRYDRRIARRSIPYGKQGSTGPVGLLFMCYQQSLKVQFEALQGKWAHRPDASAFSKTGDDPLIGALADGASLQHQWPRPNGIPIDVHISNFVTLQGGEYFFAPSINVLKTVLVAP